MSTTQAEIYVPPNTRTLATAQELQIRLLLQAPPFSGKTYAAMSFPNPVVLDFDQKLGAHTGRADIIQVPFWNGSFVDSIVRRDGIKAPPNKKDALLVWLNTEGPKLTNKQTLVLDGNTAIESAFHIQYNLNPILTKRGEIDGFAEWRHKDTYFGELAQAIKSLSCHVIYIVHETPDRDEDGKLNGKVRPLMTGQFGDKLASHFTDHFRVLPFSKPTNEEQEKKARSYFQVPDEVWKEWLSSGTDKTFWLFQTQADELAKCGSSSLVGAPKFILANYSSFIKYKRKTT